MRIKFLSNVVEASFYFEGKRHYFKTQNLEELFKNVSDLLGGR